MLAIKHVLGKSFIIFYISIIILISGCAGPGMMHTGEVIREDVPLYSVENSEVFYSGSMPCKNCDAIELEVNLNPETYSFDLVASYINHPNEAPDEIYSGVWSASTGIVGDPEAVVYSLLSDSGQDYFFMKVNDEELELISPDLRRFKNNNEMLRISKSPSRKSDTK